jgi:hypothetical protein
MPLEVLTFLWTTCKTCVPIASELHRYIKQWHFLLQATGSVHAETCHRSWVLFPWVELMWSYHVTNRNILCSLDFRLATADLHQILIRADVNFLWENKSTETLLKSDKKIVVEKRKEKNKYIYIIISHHQNTGQNRNITRTSGKN